MSNTRYTEEQLTKFWAAYKKAGWNVTKLALDSNEPYATCQHRVRACQSAGYKEEGKRVEKSRNIPDAILEHSFHVYKGLGGNQKAAARELGITRSAFQNRLDKLKSRLGLE